MMIQPKYLKLNELLNGRLFRIPPYQRAYSWERKQRRDLFSDITRSRHSDNDAVHFMATMVGLNRGKKTIATNEFQEIEVVDGQQRLTTLIILYKSLSLALDEKDKDECSFAEEISTLLVKGDDVNLLLLQTNHDTSHYFVNFLRDGTSYPSAKEAKTLADRLLLEAMKDCSDFVAQWEGSKLQLGIILKNRLALIFHEVDDEATVYSVFEVLNSRGLPVAWLDRLKSALMGTVFEYSEGDKKETIRELHQVWGEVYRWVGLNQGRSSESLRFAATLRSPERLSRVQSEEAAVETLRELAGNSAKETIEVSNWVLKVVKAVDKLVADKRRTAVTKIAHARLLAVAIELSDMSDSQRNELLDTWEKVTFRIFGMCRRDARTGVGDYVRLARKLFIEGMEYKDALNAVRALGTGEFAVKPAVEQLREKNSYEGWEEELRYFMYRYEEHLAAKQGQTFRSEQWRRIWEDASAQSIEHISPQSKGRSYVHHLGNLVLLPPQLNSKLGDMNPSKKATEYEKTGLLIAAELKPALQGWKLASVKKREEDLLKWARQEWAD